MVLYVHLDFHTALVFWNLLIHCCVMSTEMRTIRDGEPRTSTSTFTQLPSSENLALEMCATFYFLHNLMDTLSAQVNGEQF